MKITASKSFKDWYNTNPTFPVSHLWRTRNSFMCKYVLLKDTSQEDIQYTLVPTSSFSGETIQQIIMEGRALPLTPPMDKIMDHNVWICNKSSDWYLECIVVIATVLEQGKKDWSEKDLILECIGTHCETLIHTYFATDSDEGFWIYKDFLSHFNTHWIENKQWSFKERTIASEQITQMAMLHWDPELEF